MSRIANTFKNKQGKKLLISFTMFCDPDMEESLKTIETLADNGADIIEFGMPFSDPMADGATIQKAGKRALDNGAKVADYFATLVKFRKKNQTTPLVFMGYYNIVLQYGERAFLEKCKEVGVDGIIIVDLPLEECEDFQKSCNTHGVDFIHLIAQTTCDINKAGRLENILKSATGFIYFVAVMGTTGTKTADPELVRGYVKKIKSINPNIPIAVGFGIKNPEQAKTIAKFSDAIVIGSHFISVTEQKGDLNSEIKAFREALDN